VHTNHDGKRVVHTNDAIRGIMFNNKIIVKYLQLFNQTNK
jgi:hypothetical protein